MLKKFFTALCLLVTILFVAGSSAMAAESVSVVLDTPAGYFSSPEKVYTTVQKSLDKIFKGAPFDIKSVSECDAYV